MLTVENDFWDKVFEIGLETLVGKGEVGNIPIELEKELISILPSLDESTQGNYLNNVIKNNSQIVFNDDFKKYITNCYLLFCATEKIPYNHVDFYVNVVKIWKEKYNEKVNNLQIFVKFNTAISFSDTRLDSYKKELLSDIDNVVNVMNETISKNFPRETKNVMYSNIIEKGKLTKKLARRIRSDSSGDLSKRLLFKLFLHKSKYDDELFKDLITQFCDTKHKWVAQFIAMNMPSNMLMYIIGLDDEIAKDVIKNRMNNL